MGRILAMFRVSLLQTLRDRGEMFGLFVLPLLLTGVFGAVFSNTRVAKVRVLFVDEDGGGYAKNVRRLLESETGFEVRTVARGAAEPLLQHGDADAAVIVPAGFGAALAGNNGATLETLTSPGSGNAYAVTLVAEGIAARFASQALAVRVAGALAADPAFAAGPPAAAIDTAAVIAAAAAAWEPQPPVTVTGERVQAAKVRGDTQAPPASTQYSCGFVVMFALFVTLGGAASILDERELGTLRRLIVTPAPKWLLLAGKVLAVFGLATVEMTLLVGFGALALGVPWGDDPVALLAVLVPYLCAATGLGVMVTSLVRRRDQLAGLIPLVATGLAMLGGCYWQVEMMPPLMRAVAKLTPTGWAMAGLTDVVARHQGLGAAAIPALVLLGFAAVFFAVARKGTDLFS